MIARLRRALPADQREGRLRMRPTRPTGSRPSSAEARRRARIEWAADDVARLAQSLGFAKDPMRFPPKRSAMRGFRLPCTMSACGMRIRRRRRTLRSIRPKRAIPLFTAVDARHTSYKVLLACLSESARLGSGKPACRCGDDSSSPGHRRQVQEPAGHDPRPRA